MKRLNNRGISLIEIVVTFSMIMVIVSGLMAIIMNYRLKAQSSFSKLELQTYKNTITKEIQDDILTLGLSEINYAGNCSSEVNRDRFSTCANLVFKDGSQKILAVSKVFSDDISSLEKKYIYYDDEKYTLEDKIPSKIPEGRHAIDFQNIFISDTNFVSSDSTFLSDGTEVKIYSIDISIEHIDYEEDFGLHIVASNADFLSTNAMISEFQYTGSEQVYTAPADGTYHIELWGASGGDIGPYQGGAGAYTSGYINLKKNQTLYIYVGGRGSNTTVGGYNGGGGINALSLPYGATGGGATDVRLLGGSVDSFDGLKSRIMVAAGGGGANYRNVTSDDEKKLYGSGSGGAGGGLTGEVGETASYQETTGYTSHNSHALCSGGTQVLGGIYTSLDGNDTKLGTSISGGFGNSLDNSHQSGSGGGWYTGASCDNGGAGGGSSYISGHVGCQAIDPFSTDSSITHKATSEYSSYVFSNTTMIDGNGYLWTTTSKPTLRGTMPSNGVTTVNDGNIGDGYAQITYLGL